MKISEENLDQIKQLCKEYRVMVTVTENAVISVNESAVFSVTTMQHFR